jgi:hypothetical protein
LAKELGDRASELQGLVLLRGDLALTDAQRGDLVLRGATEQQYLEGRLVGARGLARHNVLAALRSSRAALLEHLQGTRATCAQLGLQPPKSGETGDVLGVLDSLARRGPPAVLLDAVGPEWLHNADAYAATCARERALYEEIVRLAAQLSTAREQAKVDLLVRLAGEHRVVLAFDSLLITLSDLQHRLRAATDVPVILATGANEAGRKQVQKAASRGSTAQRLIALCSDSMAEGFNLQGASAVVHLDMPSVIRTAEQRAGRVDRLDSRHASIDVWWPQDADEFALQQDERFYASYQFVADVLGPNFKVPRSKWQIVRAEVMIREVAEDERKRTTWDGIGDAFEPVRGLVTGRDSLVPAAVYAQMRTSRANLVSSVSAIQADEPWAFFAVAGTEWGAPQWVFFAGLQRAPVTDLQTIGDELRTRLQGRDTRAWDRAAVATLDKFLRELARAESELLPRKKRGALEELRWVMERYQASAIAMHDDERMDVTRQVLGLLRRSDADERANEAERGLFERSAVDLHGVADTWLDLIRPVWYEHLRDRRRARPLRLTDLRGALTGTHQLPTERLKELVMLGPCSRSTSASYLPSSV